MCKLEYIRLFEEEPEEPEYLDISELPIEEQLEYEKWLASTYSKD